MSAGKTKKQLLAELETLRARVAALEQSEFEYKRAKEVLQEPAKRYHRLFEYANDAIFFLDPLADQIVDVNPQACAMLDYSREQLLALRVSDIHPDEMPRLRTFARSVFERGHGWTNELTCLTRHGEFLLSEKSASVIDSTGRRLLIAIVRDVSERKRTERMLRESEARLAGILDIAVEAIISIDGTERIILFNKGAEHTFGYSAKEVLGQPLDLLVPERFRALHHRYIEDFQRSGDMSRHIGKRGEIFGRRKNGETFPAEASISKLTVNGQTVFTAVLRDITERKQMELAIRESEAQFQTLFEEAPHAYLSVDSQGIIQMANRRVCELFGYTHGELIGYPVIDLYADTLAGKEKAKQIFQRFLAGKGIHDEELEIHTRDGARVWISLTVRAIRDEQGKVVGSRSMAVDITVRKWAEQVLQEYTERLQTLREIDDAILAAQSPEMIAQVVLNCEPALPNLTWRPMKLFR